MRPRLDPGGTGAGDDGAPDARLTGALHAWRTDPGPAARAEVLAALAGARVFAAVTARAVGTETSPTTGLEQERGASMHLLQLARPDGARAVPVFTDGHAVQRWRPEARPVPVRGPLACAAAADAGAQAVVVDPGAAGFAVDAAELVALAAGQVPVPGSTVTTRAAPVALTAPQEPVPAALLEALGAALAAEPVGAARVLEGPQGLVLGVVTGAGPAELAALGDRLVRRLGGALPADGLDLAAVAPDGPGVAVPLGRRRRWFSARGR